MFLAPNTGAQSGVVRLLPVQQRLGGLYLDSWRSEVAAARILADNDAPAAYKEAQRLQTPVPVEATPSDRARLLNLLSRIELYLARTDAAAAHAQQAFDLAKQHGDRVGQAEADLNIVLNSTNRGELDAMAAGLGAGDYPSWGGFKLRAADTRSHRYLRKIGNPFLEAQGLYALAQNMKRQRRTAAILPLLDQAVEVYEKYPNKIGMWWTLKTRSLHYLSLGRTDDARADAERAYRLAKDVGFPLYVSESAKHLAAIAAVDGDHRSAYKLSVEADEMMDKAAREKTSTRMAGLAKRYETESKQRQLDKLSRLNEQQTATLLQHELHRRWLITLAGSSLVDMHRLGQ